MILKKKAILVVAGIIGGLWLLERRARAAAPSSSTGTGTGSNPGSSVGICVEDEDGNTACGGDVPVGGLSGIVPAIVLPPIKPSVYTKPPAPIPIYKKPVEYVTLGTPSTQTWPDAWNLSMDA